MAGIGSASLLADLGHEVSTALLPSLLTSTFRAPAAALGVIEGIADGLAGVARLAGGALADDPRRRRAVAVGGYAATAVLSSAVAVANSVWQVGLLRAGAWVARGLRVPARNALLADVVPASAYGRAYGFERAMDNLGAIFGPLLALALVALVGLRWAIGLSVIPGLLAAAAIVYAIRRTRHATGRQHRPIRLQIRPVARGRLGRLLLGVAAFEVGNVAATLLILRATELLTAGRGVERATTIALVLYTTYNLAATLSSIPAGRLADRLGSREVTLGLCAAQAALLVAADRFVLDILDQLGDFLVLGVDVRPLEHAGQETGLPVLRFLNRVAARAHRDEAGQVLVFGAQAVGTPATERRAADKGLPGVHRHQRGTMRVAVGMARLENAQLVGVPAHIGKVIGDHQPAVAAGTKRSPGGGQVANLAVAGIDELLVGRQLFARVFFELRLEVKRVDL